MRIFITTIIFFAIHFHSHGQLADTGPKRELLIGYKKIISRTYSDEKDSAYVSVSFINQFGEIARSEHYDKRGDLVGWIKYEYYADGLMKYQEDHGQVFQYDEQVKDLVGKIRDDTYNAKMFEYKEKLLTREVWVQAGEGYKNYNYSIAYEYDLSKRPTKEVHTNNYTGPVVTFQPGTVVVDSSFNKDGATQWIRTSSYKSDTVVIANYNDNNIVETYSIIKLSSTKKPISVLSVDNLKRPIEVHSMMYDRNDNLIQEINRVIDISKINYDKFAGDDIQIVYNEKKLPILRRVKEKGKVISTTEIRYE
jgi:hypothetical protein